MSYADFLAGKSQYGSDNGFSYVETPMSPSASLFGFQHELVEWACRLGRAAMFADCGLGKTPMQLTWARNAAVATGKPVLLLTPLAVAFQTASEAEKFGFDAAISRDGKRPAEITITNYEQIEKFDPADFGAVVCDESSAIKAFDGKRKTLVTEFLRTVPYRLLATATAAPNDYIELGTSSEALGYLGHMDMLGKFFTNSQQTSRGYRNHAWGKIREDAFSGQQWRFKGHAEEAFWRWVVSWARAVRKPSDLGFADDGYVLPDLIEVHHEIKVENIADGMLFDVPAQGLHEEREEARRTLTERCEKAAELMASGTGVAWCHLNDEGDLLTKLIDGAVQVSGSDSPEEKEEKLRAFSAGEVRVLVTKPKLGAWGLNWQHCNHMTYFPSHSYEQYYQAVRRSWRFGQTKPVTVDLVTTPGGERVFASLKRKAVAADAMFDALVRHMADAMTVKPISTYPHPVQLPAWL